MKFAQETVEGSHVIRSYEPGRITLHGNTVLESSAVIMPEQLLKDWGPVVAEDFTEAHFQRILALAPEILILGTGASQQFPHPRLTACLTERGIGVEVMDTAAACRTYNILVSEDRKVAAALLMI